MNGPFSALDKLKKLYVHDHHKIMFQTEMCDFMERLKQGLKLIRFFFVPRFLQGNQIRSVTKKSFSGLDALQHL